MAHPRLSRRQALAALGAGAAAVAGIGRPALAQAAPRVLVIGGGFAGATAARAIKQADPRLAVSLIEMSRTFTACPFSNLVIAGLRELPAQQFGYDKISASGIEVVFATATAVDPQARSVTLDTGSRLAYDRLVVAPASTCAGTACQVTARPAPKRCPMPGRLAPRPCCCGASSRRLKMAAWW